MIDHPSLAQQRRLHALVAAEQRRRVEESPEGCHWACGTVGHTANEPRPQWCSRPLGHAGLHRNAERYRQFRELARRHA
jgi:hypothetical protein